MKAKDTGSSDWPEGEPSAEQKVTLEDYQQLIIQMRKAYVQFQQMCNIPSGELTMLLTLRHLFWQRNLSFLDNKFFSSLGELYLDVAVIFFAAFHFQISFTL